MTSCKLQAAAVPQVMYRFAQQPGMICLNGTRNDMHMQQDLSIDDFLLDEQDMLRIMQVSR